MNPATESCMNLVRRKMSSFMAEAAHRGIEALDSRSPCAVELMKMDVDTMIRREVDRVCDGATFSEVMRILALGVQLEVTSGDTQEAVRGDLREIMLGIVERVERESGELQVPENCRELLLNL